MTSSTSITRDVLHPLQAFVVKRLLEYTQQEESDLGYGLLLVLGLLTTELVRSWSLALTWALNYRTGSRLRGAVLSLAFHKILKLRSVRDKSMGQVLCLFVCVFLFFCLFVCLLVCCFVYLFIFVPLFVCCCSSLLLSAVSLSTCLSLSPLVCLSVGEHVFQ